MSRDCKRLAQGHSTSVAETGTWIWIWALEAWVHLDPAPRWWTCCLGLCVQLIWKGTTWSVLPLLGWLHLLSQPLPHSFCCCVGNCICRVPERQWEEEGLGGRGAKLKLNNDFSPVGPRQQEAAMVPSIIVGRDEAAPPGSFFYSKHSLFWVAASLFLGCVVASVSPSTDYPSTQNSVQGWKDLGHCLLN